MAAVLACGDGAVLSHQSAAALWGLLQIGDGLIDVTVGHPGSRRRRAGIRRHRARSLAQREMTLRRGIPVTTPRRTLADLRHCVSAPVVRRALREAAVLGLDIGEGVEAERTRSELEHRFLRLCRKHGLPEPEVNARVGPFVVDFLWRDRRLVVETDGYRFHRGRQAFEDDRARDLELRRLGFEVVRVSYSQVVEEPGRVAEALRAARSSPSGMARNAPSTAN